MSSTQEAPDAATKSNRLDPLLRAMMHYEASDLHITSDVAPMIRVDGRMIALPNAKAAGNESLQTALLEIAPERSRRHYLERRDADFGYEISGLARFRCNIFGDRRGIGAVFRLVPSKVPSCDELDIPDSVRKVCFASRGLVLVTGPTGSGKSTTIASLIDHINERRSDHIITVEDPIEFVHQNKACLVNQREVGRHTQSFQNALRAALREDPDVVLIGELRDLETSMIAMETAETGHLVFASLHTNGAVATIDRLVSQFPGDIQQQVRLMLAESLLCVISQQLCRKRDKGRVAALEIMHGSYAISNLIREEKIFQIPSQMQTTQKLGNQQMSDALIGLVRKRQIDPMEAVRHAFNREHMLKELQKMGLITKH